jgi:hypothetical protein
LINKLFRAALALTVAATVATVALVVAVATYSAAIVRSLINARDARRQTAARRQPPPVWTPYGQTYQPPPAFATRCRAPSGPAVRKFCSAH